MTKNVKRLSAPRVALLIDSAGANGRRALSGVARFLRENHRWSVFVPDDHSDGAVIDWLKSWRGDGVITATASPPVLAAVKRLETVVVSLRDVPPYLNIPLVLTDDAAAGCLAYGHLHERGFRAFAYCGRAGADTPDERRRSFQDCVTAARLPCQVFGSAKPPSTKSGDDAKNLTQWIAELPKPVGIMAVDDRRGRQILDVCRALKIPVSFEVAVIGVDDDETICNLTDPPLSSVATGAEQAGHKAAALLGRLMAGNAARQKRLFVEPPGVVARESTNVVATNDRQIAAAVKFIREHACDGITGEDVARAAHTTRRTLERRYIARLGRSLKSDILHARLERARELLAETNYSIAAIAGKIGFQYKESFVRTFTNGAGLSPAAFRVRTRAVRAER